MDRDKNIFTSLLINLIPIIIPIFLLIILAISVATLISKEMQEKESFEGTNFQETANSSGEINAGTSFDGIIFIGDSITVGLGQVNGLKVYAKSGSTPGQWLNESVDAYKNLPANSDSIKGISIMLGTNARTEASEMKAFIQKIHDKYPGKPIYVNKILNLPAGYTGVEAYNSEIQSFCSSVDYATFIDATAGVEMDVNDGMNGVHPSIAGYQTLAKNLENLIVGK